MGKVQARAGARVMEKAEVLQPEEEKDVIEARVSAMSHLSSTDEWLRDGC